MPTSLSAALEQVRRHRAELRDSASALESALAAPAPGRGSLWLVRVRAALMELLADFRVHIELTEGVGQTPGLYADVQRAAPRLAGAVGRLACQHAELVDGVVTLLEDVEQQDGRTGAAEVARVRDEGTRLLGRVVRHRQGESDVVYEAYQVDIGGEN
ncbi:MAG TPA: hypothetical protein VFJ97_02855 [Dermatophilaceae bacterium]|nr:hypothetical protein [Dermatophilaceae bacterium]